MAASGVYELTRFTALAAGDVLPAVDVSDTTQSAHGSLLSITITNFFASIPVPVVVTSASAGALAVGLNGATNPAFKVDASTALQVAGLTVVGAVTGGTVAVVVRDSGSNASLSIDAKGTGTIAIGSVSTGAVTITPATTITGALTATLATAAQTAITSVGTLTALTVSPGTLSAQAVTATSALIGSDPGGSELLRIGGGTRVGGSLTVVGTLVGPDIRAALSGADASLNLAAFGTTGAVNLRANGGTVASVSATGLTLGVPLQLGVAYTAGAPGATGYVTLKDSTGATYKVLVST